MSGFGLPLLSRTSEVRYAAAGDAHAAYRVITGTRGDEYDVVLLLSGTMSMEALFDDPVCLRLIDGLADLGRLVVFDRCGIGLSDPPTDVADTGFEGWYRDLEAVIAASQLSRPVLVATAFSTPVVVLYCDRRPEAVDRLVLYEPFTPSAFGFEGRGRELLRAQLEGTADSVALFSPSRATEPGFREWFTRAGQFGASPRRAERAYPTPDDDEVEAIDRAAARVGVRTLVLRRPAHALSPDRAHDPFMALMPAATRVDLPGEDLLIYGSEVDALLAEVAAFVTGEHRPPAPERIVAAVLYSDLVASTDRNTAVGDARWKRVLDRHDHIARVCIGHGSGTVIKTTGDGVLALLPSATSALRAAVELRDSLRNEDLEVRVAVHVGDVDRRGGDISGLGVVIAARILALAAPSEILASNTAVGSATGAPVHFEPHGEHHLKGVPGTWPLFIMRQHPEPADT